MQNFSLKQKLQDFMEEFQQVDSFNALFVETGLENLPAELDNDELIAWWSSQDISWCASLSSYMFWLWTQKKQIEHKLFEKAYETLNPVTSKSWSMPIQITTGLDLPLLDGGFLTREFNIFQFEFSPSSHGFLVKCQEFPVPVKSTNRFDLILDVLSFILSKYNFGCLGFHAIHARKWQQSERKILAGGLGPEVRQDMIDLDFVQVEAAIERVDLSRANTNGLSLAELLRVRHRAILDSSLESKLITLWSAIEAQWGEEKGEDRLFSDDEKGKIEDALSFVSKTKLNKLIEQVGKLKNKTKNDRIIEKVEEFECTKGWDVAKTVRIIHGLRSKFAHGGALNEKETDDVQHYISFMTQIFDELISNKFSEIDIEFSPLNSK